MIWLLPTAVLPSWWPAGPRRSNTISTGPGPAAVLPAKGGPPELVPAHFRVVGQQGQELAWLVEGF
jgi:hypothetical protein